MPPARNEVIDIDERGDVRRRFERCACFTWPGPERWVEQALLADRRGDVVHHPSCDLAGVGDVDAQGKPFSKEWQRDVAKALKPLGDTVAVLAQALRAAVPIFVGGYVAIQLLGPATSYAAARAGARSGSKRRRRKGRR